MFDQSMPEKLHKRKLRSDPSSSQSNVEAASLANDEILQLSEQDFEDISNKIENKISKCLLDAEFGQREILRLIENLSSKVDNLSSTSSGQNCSAIRVEHFENTTESLEEVNLSRNPSPNNVKQEKCVTNVTNKQMN